MRIILLIVGVLLLGCPAILSVNDWAKPSIGMPITEIEEINKRSGHTWHAIRQVSEERTIYTSLDRDFDWGKCYVDFIVDSQTGIIVDYRVYGDEDACK